MGRKLYKVLIVAVFALIISSLSAKTYALDISQQDLSVSAHSSSLTIYNNGIGSTNFQITPQLEFNKLGDFITYKLTLHNNDGKRYKIASVKDDNTNDAIELTYIYPTDLDTTDKSLELTIKYVKKSSTPLQTVTATISLVDEDDVSQQITIVVPNTGTFTSTDTRSATIRNTVIIYGAFAGTIVTIYIIIRRRQKANKRSTKLPKILVTATLLLGLIPVAVIAATAKDLQFIIEFNSITLNGPYTMTFNSNGGTSVPTQIVDHNTYAAKPQNPTKPGYTFSKWLDQTNTEFNFTTTKVTKDYNLTATYTLDTYQLNLDLAGGTAGTPANPITYNYEDNDITLTNPTRDGHDFLGWTGEGITTPTPTITIPKNSTGDKSYTANWKIKSYTVTYTTDGGTPVPPTETKNYKEKFTEPTINPTKTGYDFGGWLDQNNQPYDFTTEVTADLTLKAKWNLKTYSINYTLPTGATNPTTNPATYTYEDNDITLAAPTLPNHAFKGWIDKSTPTSPTTVQPSITIPKNSTGDRTYEAVFNPIYTITYDTDGGTAISPNQFTKEKDEKIGTLATTSKDHYDFIGWYIGNDEIDENYKVTGNITIVAHYTPHEYTITYDLDGGTETTNRTKYTIVTSDFTLAEPTPPSPDKAFAGWLDISDPLNPSTTPVKTITITKGTTGNKSFKATYKNFYTVTFDVGASNDTPPQDRIILDGDKIGTLPNGPKPIEFVIYGFDGWYVGNTKIDENHEITDDTTVVAKYVKKQIDNGIEDLVGEDPEITTDEACHNGDANKIGLVVSDDPDSNARYIGKCPSNYVMFNNELWRIVGVFNVKNSENATTTESRVKIVRDTPLKTVWGGNMLTAFDIRYEQSDAYYQNGGDYFVSQWGNTKLSNGTAVNGAHLQQKLNTDFLNGVSNPETTNGKPNSRWYHTRWNRVQTDNFERYDATQSLDDTARSLIGDTVWNTGAANYYDGGYKIVASTMYNQERSNAVPNTNKAGLVRTTIWTGKVGLLYPSDYLYSPAGSTEQTRAQCIVGNASQQSCEIYTWLAPTSYKEYTMTPARCPSGVACSNIDLQAVWVYAGDGATRGVQYTTTNANNGGQYYTFRPVVYLKSDVKILSGTGEKTNPFIIGFSND